MSDQKALADIYIKHIQGTDKEALIRRVIRLEEPKSKDYLLGAEKITLKTIATLQDIHAPEPQIKLWSSVLAIISFELEHIRTFQGNE